MRRRPGLPSEVQVTRVLVEYQIPIVKNHCSRRLNVKNLRNATQLTQVVHVCVAAVCDYRDIGVYHNSPLYHRLRSSLRFKPAVLIADISPSSSPKKFFGQFRIRPDSLILRWRNSADPLAIDVK